MILKIVYIIIGLILLVKGADWFVNGASSLAKKFNISELAIGLTVVAFGTSAPELVVNVIGAAQGLDDIVFGNIIGSNNFNLFIILGIVGLISPIAVKSSTAWREVPFSLLAAILLFVLVNYLVITNSGEFDLSRLEGGILFIFFLGFLFYVYKQLKSDELVVEKTTKALSPGKISLFLILDLGGLVFGGRLVVNNAVTLAEMLNISEKIIGLTIVAAGTSLPELFTSLVAAFKKNTDIAIGNVIGSNIFNILLILSVSSFINPLNYNLSFNTDLYILAGGTLFLMIAMLTGVKKELDRWEAALLLVAYISYIVYVIIN